MPQELKINKILWLDILVLHLIIKVIGEQSRPPSKRELFNRGDRSGLINEFLQLNDVDYIYAKPLTSDLPVQDALNKLRRVGLISPARGDSRPLSLQVHQFFKVIGDDWRRWPLEVPITPDNLMRFEAAVRPPLI